MSKYKTYNLFHLKKYNSLTKIDNAIETLDFTCSFRKNHTNGITFYFNNDDTIKLFINLENIDYRITEDKEFMAGYDGKFIYIGKKESEIQ